jgi:hypothetical protein
MATAAPRSSASKARLTKLFAIGGVATIVSLGWSIAARSLLATALDREEESSVQHASALFAYHVRQLETRLRVECALMGEDTRLRSAMATPGIDEVTIRDLLFELQKRSNTELLAVLTPAGRVLTVVGAETLRSLDLSTSRFVRDARDRSDPITGVWVIDQRLMHIGVLSMRFGDRVIGFLVAGHPMDEEAIGSVYSSTGTGMSLIVQGKPAIARPNEPEFHEAAARVVAANAQGLVAVDVGARRFFGRAEQIEGALPTAHLVWLRASEDPSDEYQVLGHLFWVPVLVILAFVLLFAAPETRRA